MSVGARPASLKDPLAPYEAILAHAELELELAGMGQVEQLAALTPRWQELMSAAPRRPPIGAAPLLERAMLIHERTRIDLLRMREGLLSDLATASRAQRTAEGYAVGLGGRPRLDRSA